MKNWEFNLYHVENVLGTYWEWTFKSIKTGKQFTDSTTDDCTMQEAFDCALRSFASNTGLIWFGSLNDLEAV